MMRRAPSALLVLLLSTTAFGPAIAQTAPRAALQGMATPPTETDQLKQAPLAMGGTRHQRLAAGTYISGATLPDTTQVLAPPPLPASPEQTADDAAFHRSRALQGTPRWALAQQDAHLSTQDVLADFACSMNRTLDPATVPTLVFLLGHAGADMGPELDHTKDLWKRHRPYIGNDQPICVQRHGSLDDSPSYPSGHATLEYATALILAELMPDRATEILQRGRTLSESRIVCGVHWRSDVQSGMIEASALVAALHGSARFRADLDRARSELTAAHRAPGPAAPACHVEADAAAHSLLFQDQPETP